MKVDFCFREFNKNKISLDKLTERLFIPISSEITSTLCVDFRGVSRQLDSELLSCVVHDPSFSSWISFVSGGSKGDSNTSWKYLNIETGNNEAN